MAFQKLEVPKEKRFTIFRYDDTNPEAESKEFIDSIIEDVHWLGWQPQQITFTSDYFPAIFEFAVELIKQGKACNTLKQAFIFHSIYRCVPSKQT
jgi:glutaminyl-tRNA synthetase